LCVEDTSPRQRGSDKLRRSPSRSTLKVDDIWKGFWSKVAADDLLAPVEAKLTTHLWGHGFSALFDQVSQAPVGGDYHGVRRSVEMG